ncbi:sulfurase [Cereibacter changlensis JA139]|uniref:Sulfurase n=2 Tax=Cereibacter changlensis TaxID=402884 RepID=A0A2T4JS37_9RHOB|nr:MOSC domain-containing protein [Cereibacter changlensis]PTE20731.1 sulfurase [Cereibacter changlensis JA139]PZX53617.1 MOSC domain-containing protein [Cereibacter changlensis]
MPALIPTEFSGLITWLGTVPDRDAALEATPREALMARFEGPEDEAHGGLTRPSCSRVLRLYKRNTPIRNTRQFSILSAEDLAATATAMGLARLDPALLGATMVIEGIPDLSHLPPSSRLQAEGGATLVVDMENRPCVLPAKPIEAAHPGFGKRFKTAAKGRRGITAWVEAEGMLRLGQRIVLHVPDQPIWPHLAAARGEIVQKM